MKSAWSKAWRRALHTIPRACNQPANPPHLQRRTPAAPHTCSTAHRHLMKCLRSKKTLCILLLSHTRTHMHTHTRAHTRTQTRTQSEPQARRQTECIFILLYPVCVSGDNRMAVIWRLAKQTLASGPRLVFPNGCVTGWLAFLKSRSAPV